MSEYWKSTPKYWCKFCQTYVRDTRIDRQQHEATGRHQSNIQRSLRDLHRNHERDEREKQRAKDEVARLNGIVSGSPPKPSNDARNNHASTRAAAAAPQTASKEERKRQIAQLAEMGITVPEEYRRDMALAGDWQTVDVPPPARDDPPESGVATTGVKKRKTRDEDDETEATGESHAKKREAWGSAVKTYPLGGNSGDDFDALIRSTSTTTTVKPENIKEESSDQDVVEHPIKSEQDPVKSEQETEADIARSVADMAPQLTADIKQDLTEPSSAPPVGAEVVFKKRKPKAKRAK